MKNFYIFNAGCIRRGMDCIQAKKYLQKNNWVMVNSSRNADMIIISTCGVVRKNEENSLAALDKTMRKRKSGATTVILGCLSQINPDALKPYDKLFFIPSGKLEYFDNLISPQISMSQINHFDSVIDGFPITDYLIARSYCRKQNIYKKLFDKYSMNNMFLRLSVMIGTLIGELQHSLGNSNVTRIRPYYNIKIGDGCLSKCTYCATRFATGKSRSRPQKEIIKDFKKGISNGYQIIQLISEDTGCYGLDMNSNIVELLSQLFKIEGNYKLILIDFNPIWLIQQQKKLIPLLAVNQHRIKEIFIPFQSGSDKILTSMKRNYSSRQLLDTINELHKQAPSITLRTSALVGFPGETEEDFEATQQLIRKTSFNEVTINRYEDRPNTESSSMSDKVPQDTIERRALELVNNLNCKLLS